MRFQTTYLLYLSTALAIGIADGFTFNPTLHHYRIQNNGVPTTSTTNSICSFPSTSTCLNAFGLETLKQLLAPPTPEAETPNEQQVRDLFLLWNQALLSGDSNKVAQRYSSDPLLLPTVSDTPRTDYEGVKDYFDHFLQLQPCGEILDGKIVCGPGWAQDAGIYQFTLGNGSKIKARYSYVYVQEDGEWKIAHHHSSKMPEAPSQDKPPTISEEEVQSLFTVWADSLETRDPDQVASLYAKDAVLLPTVSDIPRTDYEGIKDYFVHFLKLEPHGEIIESHVTCGNGWCEDVGVYEFALGTSGETVRARYSFVYTYEEGQWKILHHHSSKMPEAGVPKAHHLDQDQVRALFDTWNDALLSLDPDQVTKLYSKYAVLLPTVSDRPRYTYEGIRDYFVNFLYKFPEGEILESHVTCGDDWCKNVGIYKFTCAKTGETIMARYSFVYEWEDGEWKISHHHSSVLPEAMLEAAKRLEELEVPQHTIKAAVKATFNHTQAP